MSKLPKTLDPLTIQMAIIHTHQAKVWLEVLSTYNPTGLLKKSINESRGSLTRLTSVLKAGEKLFDDSIEISESLLRLAKLSDEAKDEITKMLDEKISEFEEQGGA
jgi:hypothetical protein